MSSYLLTVLYDSIPHSFIERRNVNGQLQNCIVIPTESGQLYRTKKGEYFSKFTLEEQQGVDPDGTTHRLTLCYRNGKERERSKQQGFYKKSGRCGKAMPLLEDDGTHRKDYSNDAATDVYIKGSFCLDDIHANDITRDPKTGNKFIKCTFKASKPDATQIFCVGAIMLNSILATDIIVDKKTGYRNVPCVFKKLEMSDPFFNTHILCVTQPDGSEIEIGRFREFKEATETAKRIATAQQKLNPDEEPDMEELEEDEEEIESDPIFIDGYKLG